MKSSLKTLTRIQKFNIDEQRKILADFQREEDRLSQNLNRLNIEFATEKEYAALNPGVGDFGAYTKRYIIHREELERGLKEVRLKIEEVRDKISDMFKEQKTYEIVDDNRKKRQEKDDSAKEQKTLDEIGTNSYIKHKNLGD